MLPFGVGTLLYGEAERKSNEEVDVVASGSGQNAHLEDEVQIVNSESEGEGVEFASDVEEYYEQMSRGDEAVSSSVIMRHERVVAEATPSNIQAPTPPPNSDEGSEEEEDDDDDSDESEAPADDGVKRPPSDEEIKKYLKKILKGANFEQVTMKSVCVQVYNHYPDFDLRHKKDFIKATIKSIILDV
ncbi:jg8380 [Pararge aegeria aegeria]|uniref:Jg8380 protein n=1 Tax=Pararge aegeria aegeria TaxID=348720 RepID=A0A8S4SGX3_9NEOP|nr:jg8380 [Pararge aegeria aegeria]